MVTTSILAAAAAAADGAGKASGGLPQLNITTFPSQIFWLVVTLVVLFMVHQAMDQRVGPLVRNAIWLVRLRTSNATLLLKHWKKPAGTAPPRPSSSA